MRTLLRALPYAIATTIASVLLTALLVVLNIFVIPLISLAHVLTIISVFVVAWIVGVIKVRKEVRHGER